MAGPDRDTALAQLAYEAHRKVLASRLKMPPWETLPTDVQTAWEVGIQAAVRRATRVSA